VIFAFSRASFEWKSATLGNGEELEVRSIGAIPLLLATTALGACELLLPLHASLPSHEGSLVSERGAVERRHDRAGAFEGLPDRPGCAKVALGSECASRVPGCTKGQNADDKDCDGLYTSCDPQGDTCNTLLLDEEFLVGNPNTRWTLTGTVQMVSCQLTLQSSSSADIRSMSLITGSGGVSLGDPYYLVEVKLTLGKLTDAAQASVEVRTGASGALYRSCTIATDVVNGTHQLVQEQSGPSKKLINLSAPPGTLFLDFWSTSSAHTCQLRHESGPPFSGPPAQANTAAFTQAGTVQITARGRWVTIEHVRIFDLL
jgi:hypothetical protein